MQYILNYLLKILPYSVVFTVVYIPLRLLTRKTKQNVRHEAALFLMHLFIVAILSQTLTPDGGLPSFNFVISRGSEYYNFIPFEILRRYSVVAGTEEGTRFFIINILGNILLFVPVGFFYRLALRRPLWASALLGLCFSAFIEVSQIFLPRMTDIDDIILNTAGVFLGGVIYSLISLIPYTGVQRYRPAYIAK